MPLYLLKCYEPKNVPQLLVFSVVFNLGFTFESIKELGVRHILIRPSSRFFFKAFGFWFFIVFKSFFNFLVGHFPHL
jgi:hypothetical protein